MFHDVDCLLWKWNVKRLENEGNGMAEYNGHELAWIWLCRMTSQLILSVTCDPMVKGEEQVQSKVLD